MKPLIILLSISLISSIHDQSFSQSAQKQKIAYEDVFADLNVNDASANSALIGKEDAAAKIRSNIFIKAKVNKQHCYEGEPVLIEFKLYSALQSRSELLEQPQLAGFISYPLKTSNDTAVYANLNGREYRVFDVMTSQLIPQELGTVTIPPIEVSNEIIFTGEDNENRTYSGIVESNPISLEVEPLPFDGRPKDFGGAVGTFGIHSSIAKKVMKQDEVNLLTIEIYGNGNIEQVSLPSIHWPVSLKAEQANTKSETNAQVFPLTGKKVFEIPFSATSAGSISLPAISFHYFDPARKSYASVQTIPIPLTIEPSILKPVTPTPVGTGFQWPPVLLFIFAVLGVVAIVSYWKQRNEFKKLQSMATAEPVDESLFIDADAYEQLAALKTIDTTESYATYYKEMVKNYLQERRKMPVLPEEYFLLMFDSGEKQLRDLLKSIFIKCNEALYSHALLNDSDREWLELSFEWILQWHRQNKSGSMNENFLKPESV